jgi:competence protein ComEC
VCFAIGIALFFAQKSEPSIAMIWAFLGAALLCLGFGLLRLGTVMGALLIAISLMLAGFSCAAWRTHLVAGPVLGWRYYGPIEGRVIAIDRSASDALRVTLDQVRLAPRAGATPKGVRISLHGQATEFPAPQPGARVMTTGFLSPPSGPVEPGGFDFQRHAWFLQLGAVGYTRVPVLLARAESQSNLRVEIFQIRMAVSEYMRAQLPADIGGFAAAISAGDRSGMSGASVEALRASNLAHLLAISGLHMGLLTGFVFSVLRLGFTFIPGLALRFNCKALAAGGALMAGALYLALSGGNVATERAFIMAAVALSAVMLSRRVMSLRAVAIAACAVLVQRPEALLSPGFQMSFAATTALVAVFSWIRDIGWAAPKWVKSVGGVFISSAVAGLASAPIAAYHFNAFAHYGLFANVLSVPIMGAIVVPGAVLTVLLYPLGLSSVALEIMGLGLRWILFVAQTSAELPGARSFIAQPPGWVLPVLALGALLLFLTKGPLKFVGLAPMSAALLAWGQAPRPAVLISDSGGLVGVMTEQGRALSREKGSGFVAQNWLENDGEHISQEAAYQRWQRYWPSTGLHQARVLGQSLTHAVGKRAAAQLGSCQHGIMVSNTSVDVEVSGACILLDSRALRHTGAVAIYENAHGGARFVTARSITGERIWSQWPEGRRDSIGADQPNQ